MTTPPTDTPERPDIDAIRARLDAATAGPWRTLESTLGRHAQHDVYDCAGDFNYYKRGIARMNHGRTADEANARFIAAAPTDQRALLAYIEWVEREITEWSGSWGER